MNSIMKKSITFMLVLAMIIPTFNVDAFAYEQKADGSVIELNDSVDGEELNSDFGDESDRKYENDSKTDTESNIEGDIKKSADTDIEAEQNSENEDISSNNQDSAMENVSEYYRDIIVTDEDEEIESEDEFFSGIIGGEEETEATSFSFAGGSGTSYNPYLISKRDELANFFKAIASGQSGYNSSSVYYQLTRNIDMDGYVFDSETDCSGKNFNAHLDGNNKVVSNFKIADRKSFFSTISSGGSIENITFKSFEYCIYNPYTSTANAGLLAVTNRGVINNVKLDGEISVSTTGNSGAMVGLLTYKDDGGIISNCSINSTAKITVTGSISRVGGMVYNHTGAVQESEANNVSAYKFKENVNYGEFIFNTNLSSVYFGGLIYQNDGGVINCTYAGKDNSVAYMENGGDYTVNMGGIAYYNGDSRAYQYALINKCSNESENLYIKHGRLGGLVYDNYGRIILCENKGKLSCGTQTNYSNKVGGICYNNDDNGLIENCTNFEEISCIRGSAAGISVNCGSGASISSCKNEGNIKASGNAAGICEIVSSSGGAGGIFNCNNSGNIENTGNSPTTSMSAGIAAMVSSLASHVYELDGIYETLITINQCSNDGSIKGSVCGGIVADFGAVVGGAVISNCQNRGSVVGNRAGGVVARIDDGSTKESSKNFAVMKCTNTGEVSGTDMTGGIIGSMNYGTVEDSCNTGIVTGKSASIGGIVGEMGAVSSKYADEVLPRVLNSYNVGKITVRPEGSYLSGSAGGIAGEIGNGYIRRCFNMGQIIHDQTYKVSTGSNLGGIAGEARNNKRRIYISDCFNIGEIIACGGEDVGGIVAELSAYSSEYDISDNDMDTVIERCYSINTDNAVETIKNSSRYSNAGALFGSIYATNVPVKINHIYHLKSDKNTALIGYKSSNLYKGSYIDDVNALTEAKLSDRNTYSCDWVFVDNFENDARDGWTFLKSGAYRFPVLVNVGMKALKNPGTITPGGSYDANSLLELGQFIIRVTDDQHKPVPNARVNIDNMVLYTNNDGKTYYPCPKMTRVITIERITVQKTGYDVLYLKDHVLAMDIFSSTCFELNRIKNTIPKIDGPKIETSYETDGPSIKVDGEEVGIFNLINGVSIDLTVKKTDYGALKIVEEIDREKEELKISILQKEELVKLQQTDYFRYAKDKTNRLKTEADAYGKIYNPNNKYSVEMKSTVSFNASVAGYAVISLKDSKVKESGLCFSGAVSSSLKAYFNAGLYGKLTYTGGAGGTFKWEFDKSSRSYLNKGVIDLTASLEIAIGAGCDLAYAELAFAGKINTSIEAPFISPAKSIKAIVDGQVYANISILGFTEKVKIIPTPSLEIYPNHNTDLLEDVYGSCLEDIYDEDSVELMSRNAANNSAPRVAKNTIESDKYELKNVYADGRVKYCEFDNGTKLMVWVHDFGTKSDINRSTLAYSVNSGAGWSAPVAIKETGKGDYYPDMYVKGDKAYLVWNTATKVFDDSAQLNDLKSNMSLSFAEFDADKAEFTAIEKVPGNYNGTMQIAPRIVKDNDNIAIVWIQNSLNDMTMQKGKNEICYIEKTGNRWESIKTVATYLDNISDYDAEYRDGMLTVAYNTVKNNADGSNSSSLYLWTGGNPTKINGASGMISDIELSGDTLYFSQNNMVKAVATDKPSYTFYTGVESQNIRVAKNSKGEDAIVYIVQDRFTSEVYAAYEKNGSYSSPLKLLDLDTKVSSIDVHYNEDGTLTLATNEVEVTDDGENDIVFGNTNMNLYYNVKSDEFVVNPELYYENYEVEPGKVIEFKASVYNGTTEKIDRVKAKLSVGGVQVDEKTIDVSIRQGESNIISFPYTLPSSISKQAYALNVTPIDYDDQDTSDNIARCELGYGNLTLGNLALDDGVLTGKVTNTGYSTVTAPKIIVRKDTEDGIELKNISSGSNLAPGQAWEFSYDATGVENLENEEGFVILHVSTQPGNEDEKEQNYGDNTDICSSVPVYPDYVTLSEESVNMSEHTAIKITPTLSSESGRSVDVNNVTFYSEDNKIAVVDSDGYVIAMSAGNTKIHVLSCKPGVEAVLNVTVGAVESNPYEIADKTLGLYKGESAFITVMDEEGEEVTENLKFRSGDENILSVDAGYVVALAEGVALVEVYEGENLTDGYVTAIPVKVIDRNIREIYTGETEIEIGVYERKQLVANVIPEDTNQNKELIYESSDTNIVRVDSTGCITGYEAGSAIVTISSKANPEIKTSVDITVTGSGIQNNYYKVSFDSAGGSVIEDKVGIFEGSEIELPIPYRDGYVFVNWYTGENGTGEVLPLSLKVREDMTVHALWKQRESDAGSLTKMEITLNVGDNHDLEIAPLGDEMVTFTSGNNEIVTVSDAGVLSAIAEGSAVVYARRGNDKFEIYVYVENPNSAPEDIEKTKPIEKVKIVSDDEGNAKFDVNAYRLDIGDELYLCALAFPMDADDAEDITWLISDDSIIDVVNPENTASITIRALQAGKTYVSAKAKNGVNSKVCINVERIAFPEFTLSNDSVVLYENGNDIEAGDEVHNRKSIALKAIDSNGNDIKNSDLIWSSSDESVATVSAEGFVTAVKVDNKEKTASAIITATDKYGNGIYANCEVTVRRQVEDIKTDADGFAVETDGSYAGIKKLVIIKGKSFAINAKAVPADATNTKFEYSSDNASVATVDATGKITAKAAGKCLVSVKQTESCVTYKLLVKVVEPSDTSSITDVISISVVNQLGEYIPVEPFGTIYMKKGDIESDNIKINATCHAPSQSWYEFVGPALENGVVWVSSDEKVAKVDADGRVTAVGKGTARISAFTTDGSRRAAYLDVDVSVVPTNISFNGGRIYVKAGSSEKLKPVFTPEDADGSMLKWKTSDILTPYSYNISVNNSGVVSVARNTPAGTHIEIEAILLDDEGNETETKGICEVVVVSKTVNSIKASATKISCSEVGEAVGVNLTLAPLDSESLAGGVYWKSSDNSVVSPALENTDVVLGTTANTLVTNGYGVADVIATSADGKKSVKINVAVYPIDSAYKLSAVNGNVLLEQYQNNVKSSEKLVIKNQFGTILSNDLFDFTSMDNEKVNVSAEGIVSPNPGYDKKGTASVKVKAVLKDDPGKRSVQFTVKVLSDKQVSDVEFRAYDELSEDYEYVTEIKKVYRQGDSLSFKVEAYDSNRKLINDPKLAYSVSDSSIATASAQKDGSVILKIKKPGRFNVICLAKDTMKKSFVLPVSVLSYTPSLSTTKLTINKKESGMMSTAFSIDEVNGSEISSVSVVGVKAGKTAEAPYIVSNYSVIEQDGMYRIKINDAGYVSRMQGNYTVDIKIITDAIDEVEYYGIAHESIVSVSLAVKDAAPAVNISGKLSVNTFYKFGDKSKCELNVTSEKEINNIEVVSGQTSNFDQYFDVEKTAEGKFYLCFKGSDSYKQKSIKGKINIYVDGFTLPVSEDINVATPSEKPALELDKNPIMYTGGNNIAKLFVKDRTSKSVITDLKLKRYVGAGVIITQNPDGSLNVKLSADGRSRMNGDKISVTALFNDIEDSFVEELPMTFTVAIKDKAAINLKTDKLSLNLQAPGEAATTLLQSDCINCYILDDDMWNKSIYNSRTGKYEACEMFDIDYDRTNEQLQVKLKGASTDTGSYKIRLTSVIDENRTAYKDITVTVVDKAIAAKTSVSGAVDLINRNGSQMLVKTSFSGIEGKINSVSVDDVRFYTVLRKDGKIEIKAKQAAELSIGTIVSRINYILEGGTILSSDIKISVKQNLPKMVIPSIKPFSKSKNILNANVKLQDGVSEGAVIKKVVIDTCPAGINAYAEGSRVYIQVTDRNIKAGSYKIKVTSFFEGAQKVTGNALGTGVTGEIKVDITE